MTTGCPAQNIRQEFSTKQKARKSLNLRAFCLLLKWCPEQDSNLHAVNPAPAPQAGVSTDFTIWAMKKGHTTSILKCECKSIKILKIQAPFR